LDQRPEPCEHEGEIAKDNIKRARRESPLSPPINIIEYKNAFHLTAEITRTKLKNINVDVSDNVVRISGTKDEIDDNESNGTIITKEIQNGGFKRVLELPEKIDEDAVEASYDGTLLHLKMKKRKICEVEEEESQSKSYCVLQ